MFATTLPLAASKTDWSEFLPEKLLPAIGDTFYMVSITMLCAGLVGLIVGALLYTTRAGNIFQNRFVYTVLNILVNVIRPIPFIILIAALGPLTSAWWYPPGRECGGLRNELRCCIRYCPYRGAEHGLH